MGVEERLDKESTPSSGWGRVAREHVKTAQASLVYASVCEGKNTKKTREFVWRKA